MSRLDTKVQEENRKDFRRSKGQRRADELRAMADKEIMGWLRENPEVGELQTARGLKYYYWDTVLDRAVDVKPFTGVFVSLIQENNQSRRAKAEQLENALYLLSK